MGLMDTANGINDEGYSSYKPFEPGEYIIQCVLDPEKHMDITLNKYDKEDGTYYGLKCAWQVQATANGEEAGAFTIFKFYWDLESSKDFVHKFHISLKELRETQRWLKLIQRAPLIEKPELLNEILMETEELIKIFVTSIKTAKKKHK